MHYFLDTAFNPSISILNADESAHARKSLRLKSGDEIVIGDGEGNRYLAMVKDPSKSEMTVEVIKSEFIAKNRHQLAIAISPTKSPSRFEWFLEKATELGVDTIIPLQAKRTERIRTRGERAAKIIHAASKQSMRAYIPKLQPMMTFEHVLSQQADLKLMAHCESDGVKKHLSSYLHENERSETLVLIGPEGDFTCEEIDMATKKGFQFADLGINRLRTETAGVFCAAMFYGIS